MQLVADRDLVGEIISNLLVNAVKFTGKGGKVRVHLDSGNTIAVSDTGSGIPENLLPNIFKSDVKTTGIGTEGERGTGLGLPFSHSVMEAHRGKIRVETGPHGSTFYLEFPEDRPPSTDA